jgi:hypothetical protein
MKLKEKALLGAATILLVSSCVYLAFFDRFNSNSNEKNIKLGSVTKQKEILKRKSQNSLAWEDVSIDSTLFAGDKVFTPANSTATLQIGKSSLINMSSLTLLTIGQTSEKEFKINLEEGNVTANLNKSDNLKSIESAGKVLTLDSENANVMINSDKDSQTFALLAGAAILGVNGKGISMKENETMSQNKSGKLIRTTNQFKLNSPTSESLITELNRKQTKFEWETIQKTQSTKKIEIADNSNFKNILMTKKVEGNSEVLNLSELPSGEYFWRLKYTDENQDVLAYQKFRISLNLPPKLFYPANFQKIILDNRTPTLTFEWEEIQNATYMIEFGDYQNNQENLLNTKNLEQSWMTIKSPVPGKYWWRVQKNLNGFPNVWSSKTEFEILPPSTAKPPKYIKPINGEILSQDLPTIAFEWLGSSKIPYTLTVAKDFDFNNVVFSETSEIGNINWQKTGTGKFFWKITHPSIQSTGPIWNFIIPAPKPVLEQPTSNEDITIINQGQEIIFKWSDVYSASDLEKNREYKIHIFLEGTEIYKQKTTRNQQAWSPKEAGNYSWKIEVLGASTDLQNFKVQISAGPEKLKLKKEIRSKIRKKVKSSFNLYERRTDMYAQNNLKPTEPIEEASQFAELSWDKVKDAKWYILEIYRDEKGEEILISRRLKRPYFEWTNAPSGTYFFRVSYIDKYERQSPYSELSKLIVEDQQLLEQEIQLIFPEHKYTSFTTKQGVEWKPIENAEYYKVIVTTLKDKKIFFEGKTHCPYMLFPVDQGTYRWKVEAYNNNELIGSSNERFFKIKDLKNQTQEIYPILNPYIKGYLQADLFYGGVTADTILNQAGTGYNSSSNLDLFPSSIMISGGHNLSYHHYLTASTSFKSLQKGTSKYSEIDFGGYWNWFARNDEKMVVYFGPGGKFSSVNLETVSDSNRIGAKFNFMTVLFQATLIAPLWNFDNWKQILKGEGGVSFAIVNSIQTGFSYSLKKSKFSLFKMWPSLYESSYLQFGFGYSMSNTKYNEDEIRVNEWKIPIGIGVDHNWF